MKRLMIAGLVAGSLLISSNVARANDAREPEYEDSIMHPLRLAALVAHPIGFMAEWLIGRPIHFIVSRPDVAKVTGYRSLEDQGQFRSRTEF